MPERKILQIIPAEGWFAVYKEEDALARSPVACWALVEYDGGDRSVLGMDADDFVSFCEDIGNFVRYIHASDLEEEE